MHQQDQSILSTAIPRISSDFNSLPDIGWYGSSYLLTTCCFQLMFGKLYAEFSVKWVFLTALAIFELGSLLCAVAPNSISLIVGRAVAGLGGGGIFTGALLVSMATLSSGEENALLMEWLPQILTLSVPLHQRPKFTGIIGGISAVARVIAPFLGGELVCHAIVENQAC